MTDDPKRINPYASPAPKDEGSFRESLQQQLAESREERARWTAICMLNGAAVVIVGILLVNASNTSRQDSVIFATSGVILIVVALGLFFAGPMLWYWYRSNQTS